MILKTPVKSKLLEFLFRSMPDTKKTSVKDLLKNGCVLVNQRATTQFDPPLYPGDEVQVDKTKKRAAPPVKRFNLKLIYEDDYLVVIDKPAGLLTVGSEKMPRETAIFALNDYLNNKANSGKPMRSRKRVFVVHRLDRDVSGLLLFTKDERTKFGLQTNWGKARKEYYAIVEGKPKYQSGTLVSHLTENRFLRVFSGPQTQISKKAITHYEVVKCGNDKALLRIRIETGRKHQIRVQLADIGHPVVGDKTYGAKTNPIKRIALHAYHLEFEHPLTGKMLQFSTPLPPVLERLFDHPEI